MACGCWRTLMGAWNPEPGGYSQLSRLFSYSQEGRMSYDLPRPSPGTCNMFKMSPHAVFLGVLFVPFVSHCDFVFAAGSIYMSAQFKAAVPTVERGRIWMARPRRSLRRGGGREEGCHQQRKSRRTSPLEKCLRCMRVC
jgi:hypothetical protein